MKNMIKLKHVSLVRCLCICLAALMLLSGCTGKGNTDTTTTTATTTTTTGKTDNTPVNPSNPVTGSFEAQSVAVGQKLIMSCPTDSKSTFFLTNTSAEVVENEYDSASSVSTVTLLGKIPGKVTLVGVTESGNVSHTTVNVYAAAAEGERLNRSKDGSYKPGADNSPAKEGVAMAFDSNSSTKWLTYQNSGYVIITFEDGLAYPISEYTLTSANDDAVRDPLDWTLYGSNDGKTWFSLDSREGETFAQRKMEREFTFENDTAYAFYKLDITKNNGGEYTQIADIALYEVGKPGVSKYTGTDLPVSNATLTLEGNTSFFEGERIALECTAKSEVLFITDSDSIVISDTSYDSASGKTTVSVQATDNVESAQILALCRSDLTFASATVSAVGEGSFMHVTANVEAQTEVFDENGKKVTAANIIDSSRGSSITVNGTKLTVQVSLAKGIIVNKYALVSGADRTLDPKSWTFYGSLDGKTWVELDKRENESFEGSSLKRIFSAENRVAYSYYKLEITENNGGAKISFAEIQLFREGKYPSWAIGEFEKLDAVNPILTPNDYDRFWDPISNDWVYWSNEALYNPTAVVKDGVVCLFYRSQDHPLVSRVGLAVSLDGVNFENFPDPVVYPDDEDPYYEYEVGGGCEDPRIVKGEDGRYYMYYTAYDRPDRIARLFVAVSDDLVHWEKKGNFIGDAYNGKYKNFRTKSGAVICDLVGEEFVARRMDDGLYWMYFGEGELYTAYSDDLIHWTPLEDSNGKIKVLMSGRSGLWDYRLVEPGPQAIYSAYGILLIYNGANNSNGGDPMLVHNAYCPGAVLFDPEDHITVLERSETYFMYPEKDYELEGLVNNVCFVEGLIYFEGSWYLYYGTADSRLAVARYTPDPRDDSALDKAIEDAEQTANRSDELNKWLKTAKEAKASAYYTQEWVDDIVSNINALLSA